MPEVTLSDGVSHQLAQQVDCTGYSCPRPQMMTKKAVNGAQTNDVVEIIVDNPSSNGISSTYGATNMVYPFGNKNRQ